MDDYIIQAIFGLILFIIIMYAAKYLYKKTALSGKTGFGRSRYMKSVDKLVLSNDKWLEIVEVGEELIIIGITQNNISILRTIEGKELCDVSDNERKNVFSGILEKYLFKKEKH